MLVAHAQHMPTATSASGFSGFWRFPIGMAVIAVVEYLFQALCGLAGHDLAYRFESTRVSLHCLTCGHNTPGWQVQAAPNRVSRAREHGRGRTRET